MSDMMSRIVDILNESKSKRPADSAVGDVKPQDISGEEEVKADASAKKAPARKGDKVVSEELDDVNPKAVKKKFDDRKDKDIDNDGDTDSSDEYLHKRRKAISKSLNKESVELDEAYKTPEEAKAYEAGKKAWRDKKKYDANPNKKGSKEHTAWSKGHNEARAKFVKKYGSSEEKMRYESSELDEARNYKNNANASHKVKATVCYLDPMTRQRKCQDIYFKSKMDALGFKDNVVGFPKGAEVESIKEEVELDEAKELTYRIHKDGNPLKKGSKTVEIYGVAKAKKMVDELNKKHRGSKFTAHHVYKDGDDLEEAKGSDYQILHPSFSSAVQTAAKMAEKQGYTVDEDDWHDRVATGPRKPSNGKTNRYTIRLMKNGKEVKNKALHFQVYNTGTKYELNMYIS